VTAFIKLNNARTNDSYTNSSIQHFLKLCELDIQLHVYTDYDILMEKICNLKKKNICIEKVNFDELKIVKLIRSFPFKLPENRNTDKDNEQFLTLMNCKVEFLKKSIENNIFHSNYFAWIDFRIFHVLGDNAKYLEYISKCSLKPNLYIPGCWERGCNIAEITNQINWRFCGGFLIGDKENIHKFWVSNVHCLAKILKEKGVLLWETNIWHIIDATYYNLEWWKADHNDSIIQIPNTFIQKRNMSLQSGCKFDRISVLAASNKFVTSSASMIDFEGKRILNIRTVNYRLTREGRYLINNPNGWLETENLCCLLDNTLCPDTSTICIISKPQLQSRWPEIQGVEDIRLFEFENKLHFIGTQREYSSIPVNRMIMGEYNLIHRCMENCKVLEPEIPTNCEKNWVPIVLNKELFFIYKWYPMEIGKLVDGKLKIVTRHNTGFVFQGIKGSTIFLEEKEGEKIGIVHFSEEGMPRKYYHQIVWLNGSLQPVKISEPFYFFLEGIEFCIGFTLIDARTMRCWISRHDCDTSWIEFDYTQLRSILL